jgi:hypothetical protein
LQECFDQYQQNLNDCDESCSHCRLSFLFICFVTTTSDSCLADCGAAARDAWMACKAACAQP